MAHQLVFKSGTGKSQTYPVAGKRISIGRHPENTIVLDDPNVSVYHAEVVVENGKTVLRDLQSSNGTKVNRKRVSEVTLAEGDEIRFGPIVCHYRGEIWFKDDVDEPEESAPPPAKNAGPDPSLTAKKIAPPPVTKAAQELSAAAKKSVPPPITKAAPEPSLAAEKIAPLPVTKTEPESSLTAKKSVPPPITKAGPEPSLAARKSVPPPITKAASEPSLAVKKSAPPLERKAGPESSRTATKTAPPPEIPAEPEPLLTLLEKLRLRLAESRYFMLSLVIHSAIVILAGTIVLYKAITEPPDFVAEGGSGLISSTDDLSPPPETPADAVPVEKIVPPTPIVNAPTPNVITTSAPTNTFKVAVPQVQIKLTNPAASLARAMARNSRGFTGFLPGGMAGRAGAGRAKAMAANGMKPKSEEAVINGLIWLMQNQNPDGSWGQSNKGAMTGFGLLCFLGHGETQASPYFGVTVKNAIQWILDNGAKNEGRLNMSKSFNQPGVYEHAICAYALGEYYTMTRDKRAVDLLKQAIGHIIEGQSAGGGWIYSYDKSEDDLSVSGWQIQALKAAHLSQIKISGVDPALDKAIAYIERIRGPRGGYGYRGPADRYSLSGVGILCQLFWKGERAELRKGMDWLLDETEKRFPVKYREDKADLYAWYYHTQACLMFGGDAWKKWNAWFQDEICDVQNPDGSWPMPGGRSFGPETQDNLTGAVYRTSLCILMLEVFYRYMPVTQG
jgi:hypothetical protein